MLSKRMTLAQSKFQILFPEPSTLLFFQTLEESDPEIVSQAQSCAELCSNNSLHPTGVRSDVLKVMETLAESSSWQVCGSPPSSLPKSQ